MALQVWLPLIDSVVDQGLYNLPTPSKNDFITTASGKVGDSSMGSGSLVFHLASDNFCTGSSWTIATWIKKPTAYSNTDYIFTKNATSGFADMQMSLQISGSSTTRRLVTIVNGKEYKSDFQVFDPNVWYHVASSYDGANYRLYVNGVCIKSGSVTTNTRLTGKTNINLNTRSTNAAGTAINAPQTKYYNDFRIYDHCLSTREIQELAKGLVAHWTMNDPTPAVGFKLRDSSGYGRHALFTSAGQPIVSGSVNGLTSPRYTNHIHLNSNAKYASASLPLEALDSEYTFAWWGKLTNTTTGVMYWAFTGSTTKTNMYLANNYTAWNTGDGSASLFRKIGTTTSVGKLARGSWHHYTITGNGEHTYLYVDGNIYAESDIYKNLTYALTGPVTDADRVFFINGWSKADSYRNASTCMSDLRVYATALNADQVKELYNNPVSVCKGGTLMCMEVVE